jgi:hypothetical protein
LQHSVSVRSAGDGNAPPPGFKSTRSYPFDAMLPGNEDGKQTLAANKRGQMNKLFFDGERSGAGNGVAGLVAMSRHGDRGEVGRLQKPDVLLDFQVFQLTRELPSTQHALLCEVLAGAEELGGRKAAHAAEGVGGGEGMSSPWPGYELPRNKPDVRRRYLEGKHSFHNTLPRPHVFSMGDHSYVSLIDCIANLFAWGRKVDSLHSVICAAG